MNKGIIIIVTVNKKKLKHISPFRGKSHVLQDFATALSRCKKGVSILHNSPFFLGTENMLFLFYLLALLLQDYIFITGISCLYGDVQARIFLAATKLFHFLLKKGRTNSG